MHLPSLDDLLPMKRAAGRSRTCAGRTVGGDPVIASVDS